MCEENPGYTTIVGPQDQLFALADYWYRLETTARYALDHLQLIEPFRSRERLTVGEAPGVAVAYHRPEFGGQLADLLQAEFLTFPFADFRGLVCEPGFTVRAASAPLPNSAVVTLDPALVSVGHSSTSSIIASFGPKVALLDSGDSGTPHGSVVFTTGNPHMRANAPDYYGHGTAIADIIRAARPHAEVYPVNILDATGSCPSHDLFSGLIYCFWSDERFDVVNASLSSAPVGPCPSSLGRTIAYLDRLLAASGLAHPLVVAAGGNWPKVQRVGYPAQLSSAIAVGALDWSGVHATYNVSNLSAQARVEFASGGTKSHPVGTATPPGGMPWPVYGTSFAAAFVTAAHLL